MKKLFGVYCLLFCCAAFIPELNARQNSFYSDAALDELRLEVSDLKHDLHSARIEINLLEEKLSKYEKKEQSKQGERKTTASQTDQIEKKIAHLEKLLEKATCDLRTLSSSATQNLNKIQELETSLSSQDKKFEEVVKLKGTLTSISKAIGQNKAPTATRTYRVKTGDSLERIARAQNTSVEEIKQLNQLQNDKIIIGQELKLPAEI